MEKADGQTYETMSMGLEAYRDEDNGKYISEKYVWLIGCTKSSPFAALY